jgi:spermidine synthase
MKRMYEVYGDLEITKGDIRMISNEKQCIIYNEKNEKIMYENGVFDLYEQSLPTLKGDVLIVGLGSGIIGYNYKDKVDSKTYIEILPELIEICEEYQPEFTYINEDAFLFDTNEKYDTIFLDIYHRLTPEYKNDMRKLMEKYSKFLKEDGEIDHLHIHKIKIEL